MEISEVRIKLMEDAGDRLQAFCSITFDDCFVIRDLKIIEGANGPFVAMPSRKLTARCPECGCKNHLRAPYCNQCGLRLKDDRASKDENGRAKLYADIAHPINSRCREMIQERIITAFREEQQKAQLPGYVSTYSDFDMEEEYAERAEEGTTRTTDPAQPRVPAPHRSHAPRHAPDNNSGPHRSEGPHKPPHHIPPTRTNAEDHGQFGAGII